MKIKRKVVLHGLSTLTISLPANWTKKFNIKKGDELNVEEYNRELRINTEKEITLDKKQFNIGNLKRLGRSYITSSYVQGCDEIFISYDDPKYIETIRDLISKELIGFEIIKQNSKDCLIKNLAGPNKNEFDSALRRILLLLLDLSNESLDAMEKRDIDRLKNIELMDCNINKFSNYCLRLLIKTGHVDFKKTSLYYHLIKSLEEVGDRYKDLCNFYLNNTEKIDKDFITIFRNVNNLLNEFYELFYKYDEEKIEDLFRKVKLVHNKTSNSGTKMGIYLSSICKDIRDLLTVLIEINL